jgi:uncharacterized protein involved in exopolysaccharide biosynthesis
MDAAPKPAPSTPIKPPSFPIGVFFQVFLCVFLLVVLWTIISTAIAPRYYESDARIEVYQKTENGLTGNYNVTKNEAEFIMSELLLRKVIAELDLNDLWGNKYNEGVPLKTLQALELLQERIAVTPVSDTTFIEIHAFDESPQDAATIAGTVANIYVDYVATNSVNVQAQVVDNAYANQTPVRPNVHLKLILGFITGTFLGAGVGILCALLIYFSNRNKFVASVNHPV